MTEARFNFISDAAGGDQYTVVSFSGNEAISTLYQYELEIKSPLSAVTDLDDLLDSPARFVTEIDGHEYPIYGVLSSIDELRTVQGYVYYRAVLVPRLWWLSTYKTNEIYTLEKTVDDIIRIVLENAGFSDSSDFDLTGLDNHHFLERDYRCQFGESDFDFISRLMENEGIFYYFDHSGTAEKIIFINDMDYMDILHPGLNFNVIGQTTRQYDCINAWSCRKQRLAAEISIRDYNPGQPSLDISDTVAVDQMGRGTEYLYGENIRDTEEAAYLSTIRAEERLCNKTRYYGESSVTRLQSGYLFSLNGHPNNTYNNVEYLTVEVTHEGQHLDMTVSAGSGVSRSTPQYRNSFVAIIASEQFRPPRNTPKPRFYGTMTAFIYSEEGNNIAEMDEYGRYRVHLPFDRADGSKESTDPNRKASTWIRKAQDYVGEEKGSYFPLTGGTEVLLSFINGDPDQPIIVGAVPNASEPSLLSSEHQFESMMQTGSGNKIRMGDVEGEDRVIMESPTANSWLRIGTPNDPAPLGDVDADGASEVEYASDGIRINTSGSIWSEAVHGRYGQYVAGAPKDGSKGTDATDFTNNTDVQTMLAYFDATGAYQPSNLRARHGGADETLTDALSKAEIKTSSLDTFNTQEGNVYDFGGYWVYNLGNAYVENHIDQQATLNTNKTSEIGGVDKEKLFKGDGYRIADTALGVLGGLSQLTVISTPLIAGAIAFSAGSKAGGVVVGGGLMVVNPIMSVISTGIGWYFRAKGQDLGKFGNLVGGIIGVGQDWQIGDIVDGPNSGPITTWAYKVGSSFDPVTKKQTKTDPANGIPLGSLNRKYDAHYGNDGDPIFSKKDYENVPMHTDTTHVEKKFADSYNFTQGNTIDITHGNSEIHTKGDVYEYKYGGLREETHFSKGYLSHWAKSGHGVKAEVNWDKLTHQIANYKYAYKGFASIDFAMPTKPTFKVAVSMAPFDFKFGATTGTALNIKFSSSISFNFDFAVGYAFKLERKMGGETVWDEATGTMSFKTIKTEAKKKEVALEEKKLEFMKLMTKIHKGDMEMEDNSIKVKKNKTSIDLSDIKFL